MQARQDCAWCGPRPTLAAWQDVLLLNTPSAADRRQGWQVGPGAEQFIYAGLARLGLVLKPGRLCRPDKTGPDAEQSNGMQARQDGA